MSSIQKLTNSHLSKEVHKIRKRDRKNVII